MSTQPTPNLNDTLEALKKISAQVEHLAKLKLEETSKEVARYAASLDQENKRRGR
jgi:hypothetical protein